MSHDVTEVYVKHQRILNPKTGVGCYVPPELWTQLWVRHIVYICPSKAVLDNCFAWSVFSSLAS